VKRFPLVIAALGFLVIAPALWTGWSGDDAFYSVLDGILGADRVSLAAAMYHSFDLWWSTNGRFQPGLVLEKYVVFYVFTNLIAYKLFLVAMTLATVEVFRRCVAAYSTVATANLAALIAAALLTERGYHDSILAYNGMPQMVALLVLSSLMVFRHALREPNGRARTAAAVLFALAALTYEDAYGLALLYVAIAKGGGRSWRQAFVAGAPFLATAFVLATFGLVLRGIVHIDPGSLYGSNVAAGPMARTAAMQIVAAVPMSYWAFDPSGIFRRNDLGELLRNTPISPLVLAGFAFAAWFALRAVAREATSLRGLVAIGALVVVLPALPLAILTKYQHELRYGLGYLPVFFENFGVALMLAAGAIASLRAAAERAYRIVWTVAITAVATVTAATNLRVAFEGWPSRSARAQLERQLDTGLLAGTPPGTAIGIAPDFDWISYGGIGPDGISTRGLFFLHGGLRVRLVSPQSDDAQTVLVYDKNAGVWAAR
jgi:hypothetical protein